MRVTLIEAKDLPTTRYTSYLSARGNGLFTSIFSESTAILRRLRDERPRHGLCKVDGYWAAIQSSQKYGRLGPAVKGVGL